MKNEKIRRWLGLARRAGALSLGSRETRLSLRCGEVHLVLLAVDGSPRDQERLQRLADRAGVPARVGGTRAELGACVGRRPVAVLGVRNRELAEALRGDLDGVPAGALGRIQTGRQEP